MHECLAKIFFTNQKRKSIMILDTYQQWKRYSGISPRLRRGMEFLTSANVQMKEGRHEIDGDELFALVVKTMTTPAAGRQLEVHRKYIDVHFMHSGAENVLWAPLELFGQPAKPYDLDLDAALYLPVPQVQAVRVDQGSFAVFFPEDSHAPSCQIGEHPAEVFKVVLKILV